MLLKKLRQLIFIIKTGYRKIIYSNMKLKRFSKDNYHYGYIKKNENITLNEQSEYNIIDTKIELLANISTNWNSQLSEKFTNIKNLYKLPSEQLIKIKEKYITSITKEENIIDKEETVINENITNTLNELKQKYGENDAIESIKIFEDKIVFELLCDTDISQSLTEYNGIELVFNKICEIPINENNSTIEPSIDYENLIIEQSIYMNKYFLDNY